MRDRLLADTIALEPQTLYLEGLTPRLQILQSNMFISLNAHQEQHCV
jgi:hypothetical protein